MAIILLAMPPASRSGLAVDPESRSRHPPPGTGVEPFRRRAAAGGLLASGTPVADLMADRPSFQELPGTRHGSGAVSPGVLSRGNAGSGVSAICRCIFPQ